MTLIKNNKESNQLFFQHQVQNDLQLFCLFSTLVQQQHDEIRPAYSLRGGGFCNSKIQNSTIVDAKILEKSKIPLYFFPHLTHHSFNITDVNSSSLDINKSMNSIQWFYDHQQHFNSICFDDQTLRCSYNQIESIIESFLKVIPLYIKQSGAIVLSLLHIVNDLLRILFTYQIKNTNHQIFEERKNNFQSYISEIKQEIEQQNESIWNTGIEFELMMINTVITHIRTNSEKGKEFAYKVLTGLIISFGSMKLSDEFLSAIKDAGSFLLETLYDQYIENPLEKYQIYYYFENLRWKIIQFLENQHPVKKIFALLQDGYNKYIFNSSDWTIHYCWINMISDLVSYRPIIQKSNIQKANPQIKNLNYNWEELIENKLIQIVPYSKQIAKLQLFSYDNKNVNQFLSSNLKELKLFQEFLISNPQIQQNVFKVISEKAEIKLWNHYLNFEFKKNNQPLTQIDQLLSLFSSMEISKQINFLIQLYEKHVNQTIQIYQDQEEAFENLYTIKDDQEFKKNIIIDNIKDLLRQCLLEFQQIIYIIFLLDQGFKLEFNKIKQLSKILLFKEQQTKKNNEQPKHSEALKSINESLERINITQTYEKIIKYHIDFMKDVSQNSVKLILFQNNEQICNSNTKSLKQTKDWIQNLLIFREEFQLAVQEFQKAQSLARQLIKSIQLDNLKIELGLNYGELIQLLKDYHKTNLIQFYQEFTVSKDDIQNKLINNDEQIAIGELEFQIQIQKITKQLLRLYQFQINEFQIKFSLFTNQEKRDVIENNQSNQLLQNALQFVQNQQSTIQQEYFNLVNENQENNLSKSCKKIIQQIFSDQTNLIQKFKQDGNFNQYLSNMNDIQVRLLQIKIKKQVSKEDLDAIVNNYNILRTSLISKINNQKEENQLQNDNQSMFISSLQTIEKFQSCLKKQIQTLKNVKDYLLLKFIQNKFKGENQNIYLVELENNLKKMLNDYQETQYINQLYIQEKKDQLDNKQSINNNSNQHKSLILLNEKNNQELFQKSKIFFLFEDCSFFRFDTINEGLSIKIDQNFILIIKELQEGTKDVIYNSIQSSFQSKSYKVRESLFFNLTKIQSQLKEENVKAFCQQYIKEMWICEKHVNVRQLLKNKEFIKQQKKLFSTNLYSFSNQIENEFRMRIQRIETLEQQIRLEGKSPLGEQLNKQLKQEFKNFQESFENITEMSNKLDLNLIFLKEIVKDIKQIKSSIDKLYDTLQEFGDDLKKLRGKNFRELLDIKKYRVLDQKKTQSLDQVYIELHTKEYNPVTGIQIPTKKGIEFSTLISNKEDEKDAEINKFLWIENNKDVLLLRGQAGSGKSRAATKIEETLWEMEHIKPNWKPIYISLPGLKNPIHNLIKEALGSEQYQFDHNQIKEFKDEIFNDSYDEMKQQFIQENIYKTNRLKQELNIDKPGNKVKIIITTRNDILNQKGYHTQFYAESVDFLKEVEIQPFNQNQTINYIQEYCLLSVKRKVVNCYEHAKQIQGQLKDREEIIEIWQNIENKLFGNQQKSNYSNQDTILDIYLIDKMIEILKTEICFSSLSKEVFIYLRKELNDLWSQNKFLKTIENLQIKELLQTPFMMSIIVQVLPSILNQSLDDELLLKNFKQNYLKLKLKKETSKQVIEFNNRLDKIQFKPFFFEQNDDKLLEQKKEMEIQFKLILQKMEDKQFFQHYTIAEKLDYDETSIIFKRGNIEIGKEETDLVYQALKMQRMKVTDFYESFINFYHQSQLQKWKDIGKAQNYEGLIIDIEEFSESLALEMTQNQQVQIIYRPKGKLKMKMKQNQGLTTQNWEDQYFDNFLGNLEYNKILKSCILLTAKGNSYSFLHKSIQEFYVGRYIVRVLTKIFQLDINNDQKQIKESLINQQNFNLSQPQYLGTFKLIKNNLRFENNQLSKIISIIQLTKESSEYISISSNLFYILSLYGLVLENEELTRIKLANTNLQGLSFYQCNLSQSKFDQVNIDCCNFNNSLLNGVEWTNIICQEKPALIVPGKQITTLQYTKQNQIIVSGTNDGQIIFWNLDEYKIIIEKQVNNGEIDQLKFYDKYRQMLCSQIDLITLWNVQDLKNISIIRSLKPEPRELNNSVFLTPDFQYILYSGLARQGCKKKYCVYVWDIYNQCQKEIEKDEYNLNFEINTAEFSNDGKLLAVSGYEILILFKVDEQNKLEEICSKKLIGLQIQYIQFQEQADELIIGEKSGDLFFFRLIENRELQHYKTIKIYQQIGTRKISRNSNYLILQIAEKDFEVYKLTNIINDNQNLANHLLETNLNNIMNIRFCFIKQYFYFAQQNTVSIKKLTKMQQLEDITEIKQDEAIQIISISNNGQFLVIGNINYEVSLLETQSFKKIKTIITQKSVEYISFSFNDQYLCLSSKNTQVWDISDLSNMILLNTFENIQMILSPFEITNHLVMYKTNEYKKINIGVFSNWNEIGYISRTNLSETIQFGYLNELIYFKIISDEIILVKLEKQKEIQRIKCRPKNIFCSQHFMIIQEEDKLLFYDIKDILKENHAFLIYKEYIENLFQVFCLDAERLIYAICYCNGRFEIKDYSFTSQFQISKYFYCNSLIINDKQLVLYDSNILFYDLKTFSKIATIGIFELGMIQNIKLQYSHDNSVIAGYDSTIYMTCILIINVNDNNEVTYQKNNTQLNDDYDEKQIIQNLIFIDNSHFATIKSSLQISIWIIDDLKKIKIQKEYFFNQSICSINSKNLILTQNTKLTLINYPNQKILQNDTLYNFSDSNFHIFYLENKGEIVLFSISISSIISIINFYNINFYFYQNMILQNCHNITKKNNDSQLYQEINNAKLLSDNQTLVFTTKEKDVIFYDIKVYCKTQEFKGESFCISLDEKLLITSLDRQLFLYDLQSKSLIDKFEGHQSKITSFSISSNNMTLISASHNSEIKIWSLQSQKQTQESNFHERLIQKLKFSLDGSTLFSNSDDGTLNIWNIENNKLEQSEKNHYNFNYSPEEEFLLSQENQMVNTLIQYDLKFKQHKQYISFIKWNKYHIISKDELVIQSDNSIIFFNEKIPEIENRKWHMIYGGERFLEDKFIFSSSFQIFAFWQYYGKYVEVHASKQIDQILMSIKKENDQILSVCISFDDKYLILSTKIMIEQFNIEKKEKVAQFLIPMVEYTYFVMKGYLLTFSNKEGIQIWDIQQTEKQVLIQSIKIDSFFQQVKINSRICVSQNGQFMAFVSGDEGQAVVNLWNMNNYTELAVLKISDLFYRMTFSPNNKVLSVQINSFILIWNLNQLSNQPQNAIRTCNDPYNFTEDCSYIFQINKQDQVILYSIENQEQLHMIATNQLIYRKLESNSFIEENLQYYSIEFICNISNFVLILNNYHEESFSRHRKCYYPIILEQAFQLINYMPFYEGQCFCFFNSKQLCCIGNQSLVQTKIDIIEYSIHKKLKQIILNQNELIIQMKTSKRDYYLSYCFDKSNMIEIIKYPQDECKHLKIKGKKDSIVILLEFSCQEEILISGNSDQSIRIWNVEYQIQFYCLDGFNQSISSLSISPDGNRFAVGFDDGTLSLFKFFQQQYSLQKMKNQIQQWENFEDQIEGKKNTIAENGKESEIKIIGATLYKSFSKQPLIQAKNCKINVDTIINDNQGQSLLQLFEQKGAIPEDLKN